MSEGASTIGRRSERSQTLCWKCNKACGDCSWSEHKNNTPVPGWTAIPTKVKLNNNELGDSYIVIACPEFEEDRHGSGSAGAGMCGDRKRGRKRA